MLKPESGFQSLIRRLIDKLTTEQEDRITTKINDRHIIIYTNVKDIERKRRTHFSIRH